MFVVVLQNPLRTGGGAVQRAKRHQSFAHLKMAAETGLLDEHRLAGGQVADAAVAEPAAVRFDVDPLGDREFGPRFLDVSPETAGGGRGDNRIGDLPAIRPSSAVRSL